MRATINIRHREAWSQAVAPLRLSQIRRLLADFARGEAVKTEGRSPNEREEMPTIADAPSAWRAGMGALSRTGVYEFDMLDGGHSGGQNSQSSQRTLK